MMQATESQTFLAQPSNKRAKLVMASCADDRMQLNTATMSSEQSASLIMPTLNGPVECRHSGVGGGRGVFATKSIDPGSIILTEVPLVDFGNEHQSRETGHAAVVRTILRSDNRSAFFEQLRSLHPTRLADLSAPSLELARKTYQALVDDLVRAVVPFRVEPDDALLLFLKVQLNALETGLFIKIALVNHNCFPNCSVLSSLQKDSDGREHCIRADVVANRKIDAGEEITFCFHGCLERSFLARAKLFRNQHLCELAPAIRPFAEQLDGFQAEVDVKIVTELLARVESRLDVLEATHQKSLSESKAALSELASLEDELSVVLHPHHLVLCRVGRLTSSAARNVLAEIAPHADMARRLVRVALQVRASQALYLSSNHLQTAQAAEDLALALSVSLTCDREHLFSTYPDLFGDFTSTSHAESALQREARKIRELYSTASHARADNTFADMEGQQFQQIWSESETSALEGHALQGNVEQRTARHSGAPEDWSIFD